MKSQLTNSLFSHTINNTKIGLSFKYTLQDIAMHLGAWTMKDLVNRKWFSID